MDPIQKHRVTVAGLVLVPIYSFFAVYSVYIVLDETIFRPPNQIFPMTDMIGWLGYLYVLLVIFGTGVCAMIGAYRLGGIFKVLYIAGALAMMSSASYLPLSFLCSAEVDFHPSIRGVESLAGKWVDNSYKLDLSEDGTYVLEHRSGGLFQHDTLQRYEGVWSMKGNKIYLSKLDPGSVNPWVVTKSQGHYFITYGVPENFDAWLGNLGLMREEEWLDSN